MVEGVRREGEPRLLTVADLRALPDPARTPAGCACADKVCPGWESIPAPLGPPLLRQLGTLLDLGIDEPIYAEWSAEGHKTGGYWSGTTPVSPVHFPYNRCAVWACNHCGRGFLQYTEFGGYYIDHRLRQIDPALVV